MHSPRRSVMSRNGIEAARKAGKPAPETSPSGVALTHRAVRPSAALAGRKRVAFHAFLEIEQAEIVLAALAHHGLVVALGGIGIEPCDLLHDLTLQVAGVGGKPEARAVLLRPDA